MDPVTLVVLIVVLGLLFDYTNGFHDAANVVSTVIATRVLTPLVAILLAGVLNTVGALQTSGVAETIASGLVDSEAATQLMVLSALMGAIAWNVLTWYFGVPSSSSYALIGGLVGSALVHKGAHTILWKGVLFKVVIPMILSPFIGFAIAFFLMKALYRWVKNAKERKTGRLFGHLQIGSASIVALAHGLNDAQKSMGIITLGLFAGGVVSTTSIPLWVILACALVMGLGTASGGFRIIRTVGFQITKLQPIQGFATEMSASLVILTASFLGMPLSSTHMIVGSVVGVGSARKVSAVSWATMNKLILAWIFTLPGAGIAASLFYQIISYFL